jgi:hypothetical protein
MSLSVNDDFEDTINSPLIDEIQFSSILSKSSLFSIFLYSSKALVIISFVESLKV